MCYLGCRVSVYKAVQYLSYVCPCDTRMGGCKAPCRCTINLVVMVVVRLMAGSGGYVLC